MKSIKRASLLALVHLAALGLSSIAAAQETTPETVTQPEQPVPQHPKGETKPAPEVPATPPSVEPHDISEQKEEGAGLQIPIKLSGYIWVDTGYMMRDNSQAGQYDQNANYMQGRFVLAAEYQRTFGNDFYGLARAELIAFVNEFAKSQYEPHTLDAYLKVGQKKWDVQLGRFLAWEVYQRGQGIELYTAEEAGALGGPSLYWLDLTRGHKNEAGQAAVHYYPFEFLGFELAGVYGQESNQNNLGIRPAVDFNWKGLQIMAGAEYLQQTPQTEADKVSVTSFGYAGRVQYTLSAFTLGLNYAQGNVEYIDIQGLVDSEKTFDKTTMGAFLDINFWKNSIGFGYHRTEQLNEQGERNTHDQGFVSYLYRLPVKGLSAKAVFGLARAHIEDIDTNSNWDNYLRSVRVRVAYDFQ